MLLKDEFSFETFVELIDDVYDEIFIWDADMRVVYANKACYRHYGLRPEDFIGKSISEFTIQENLWTPTCVPDTVTEKKPVLQKQKTFLGTDIVTISVPIFDEHDNVKYIVQSVRDEPQFLFKELSPIRGTAAEMPEGQSILYKSALMKQVVDYGKRVAPTKAPILILGETGTGKTLLAKYIHEQSDRRDKPFININMASLSPSVIESEFFGYKEGAFTGASRNGKKGIFEAANGGTLFLDEIGEFPYELQAKFLHVLQENEFIPVGGTAPIKLDIRLICATNCDLQQMIDAGKFRKDLYHRINMLEITVPPLRKRKEDLLLLSAYFLNDFNKKYDRNVIFSDEVVDVFMKYLWAGNVRELSNVVERGVIISDHGTIRMRDLPESFFSMDNIKPVEHCALEQMSYVEAMEQYEQALIQKAYLKYPSSRKLAKALQVSQATASRLIRKYIEK